MVGKTENIVLVASDMAGKPVNTGLARTFTPEDQLKVFTLTNDVIVDYGADSAERIFGDIKAKVEALVKEFGEKATYYLMCSGSVINSCVALTVLNMLVDDAHIRFLVWERNRKRYEVYTTHGERITPERSDEEEEEEDWR